jgi:hypothetical protein
MRGSPLSLHALLARSHSVFPPQAATKREKNAGSHMALLTAQKEQHSITVKINFFILHHLLLNLKYGNQKLPFGSAFSILRFRL